MDVVACPHDEPIISFILLLHRVEPKLIHSTISQDAWWFQIAHQTQKLSSLRLVELIFNNSDQLYLDTLMLKLFIVVLELYLHLSFDIFAVLRKDKGGNDTIKTGALYL